MSRAATAQAPSADVQALTKQVQELAEMNKVLADRVADLEKRISAMGKSQDATPAAPPADSAPAPAAQESAPAPEQASTAPAAAAKAEDKEKEKDKGHLLEVRWDKGLRLESQDGKFRLKLGGRVYFDAATFRAPDYWFLGGDRIDEHDGMEVSRLRMTLSGEVYEDFLFKIETDFAGDEVQLTDAFVGVRNLPYAGTVRAGQFSEPLGLEALTSSRFITFMERSMATQAFIPYRSLGLGVSNAFFDKRMTASLGVFNGGIDRDNFWSFTGRLTGLPWYENKGRRLLHLGLGFAHRNPESDYDFRARPGSNQANEHMNTGELPVDNLNTWSAETALVVGPFSLQGEYLRTDASFMPENRHLTFFGLRDAYKLDDRHFDGYYVQASCFLTGEHRMYDPSTGAFDRVIPRKNVRLKGGGWGALELALRYDTLDLDEFDVRSGVRGGTGRNWTAGLNWYLNPNMRIMLNYVHASVDQWEYDGGLDIFQARFQADF